jgi:uncharacterized protein with NRDE domain
MCLILFGYHSHPRFRLVLAANRDEFYTRPTDPADFWEDAPEVLAGRDRSAGGTWLGVTRGGRFAALTNIREPGRQQPQAPSRGALVADYLRGSLPPGDYLHALRTEDERYNGFNLLAGDQSGLWYYSNRADRSPRRLEPGLYGLSNALLNTPWPKVERGRRGLAAILTDPSGPHPETLLDLLADRSIPPDQDLPDTGVGLERERLLAPLFIDGETYGTRSSSVLLLGDERAELIERSHDSSGEERRFRIRFDDTDAVSSPA